MGGQILGYDLGLQGVNVDKSPIHLADGELTKAQNAVPDPAGVAGGLRKRPGLVKFTSNVAAGSVLGGIGAPIDLASSPDPGTVPPGAVQVTYWGRCAVGSNLGAPGGFWYSLDGFLTSGNIIEISQ